MLRWHSAATGTNTEPTAHRGDSYAFRLHRTNVESPLGSRYGTSYARGLYRWTGHRHTIQFARDERCSYCSIGLRTGNTIKAIHGTRYARGLHTGSKNHGMASVPEICHRQHPATSRPAPVAGVCFIGTPNHLAGTNIGMHGMHTTMPNRCGENDLSIKPWTIPSRNGNMSSREASYW